MHCEYRLVMNWFLCCHFWKISKSNIIKLWKALLSFILISQIKFSLETINSIALLKFSLVFMQKGTLAIFQCFKNTKKLPTSNPHHSRLVPRIGTFEWLWPMDYKSYETFIALTYQPWRRDRESLSLIFVNTEKSRKYDTLRNFLKTCEVFGIVIKLHLEWLNYFLNGN